MKRMIKFIGLDVHKDFITVAIANECGGEVASYGEIVNTPIAVSKLAKKLSRNNSHDLCFVYEAGCFGFILYRQLTKLGHSCVVAAPSLIPRKPGDRVKTIGVYTTLLWLIHSNTLHFHRLFWRRNTL